MHLVCMLSLRKCNFDLVGVKIQERDFCFNKSSGYLIKEKHLVIKNRKTANAISSEG